MFRSGLKIDVRSDGSVSRRGFLRQLGGIAGVAGMISFGWRDRLLAQAAELQKSGKSMILLWMDGGPSQFETFNPKPMSKYQGPAKSIATSVPGVPIAEYWPKTAQVMDKIALIQSMSGGPTEHDLAIRYVRTGYKFTPSVEHPTWGSMVAKHRDDPNFDLPAFVRIGKARYDYPSRNPSAGVLGVTYNPLRVQEPGELPADVTPQVPTAVFKRRFALAQQLDQQFASSGTEALVKAKHDIYDRAARFALSPRLGAFDLSRERDSLRDAYGRTSFGQGCLLARRMIEQGVSFVEVLSAEDTQGWDTHRGSAFASNKKLCGIVDPAYATLLRDLADRGMLENTLVVWMGEFGRTPSFKEQGGGRDHYSKAWLAALAGAGVRGGQVIGSTDADGVEITNRPVTIPDLMTTYCSVLGLDPTEEYYTPDDRPLKTVDGGAVVSELFS